MKAARLIHAICLGLAVTLLPASGAAQTVDHRNLTGFESLTAAQIQAAQNLRLVFINRSVGHNIDQGLDCLAVPFESAPNFCRRSDHPAPEFSVPESSFRWSGSYNRSRWEFGSWPGTGIAPEIDCNGDGGQWYNAVACFIDFVDSNPNAFDVVSFQFSYLEVTDQSDIANPVTGFFGSNPPQGRKTMADLEALRQRHPNLKFVLQTTSLARTIGTAVARDLNAQMRTYASQHNWPLLDIAAILSHDVSGAPCYDNRDGVAYIVNGHVRENYPSDGFNYPAICQQYTSEVNGGHLGSPSAGMIRAAKGWWVLMADIASGGGGTPPPPPPPPPPAPPSISAITCTVEGTRLTCTATFDGEVSEATTTMTVRNADGQSATRTVTIPINR
jgi:hypothetical protein